jgi:broad specificity phosphatase PhoE
MGIGSSKNRPPVVVNPVVDVNHSMQSSKIATVDNMTVAAAAQQQQPQSQSQPQPPPEQPRIGQTDIGSASFDKRFRSADNSIHFVVDHDITDRNKEFQFDNSESDTDVLATHFNFFFIRHAKSCANEEKNGEFWEVIKNAKVLGKKLKLSDPFISNDGIFATFLKRAEYEAFFQKRNPDHYFCTPLGRTWYTAGVLLPGKISKFQIAPHLRENELGPTNNPYSYETNVKRFEFFKKYANALTGVDIQGTPGYALMNKAFGAYGSDFIDEIGIDKFIQWYIKNENTLGRNKSRVRNVVVVCHSDLIKKFCKAHLNKHDLIARGMAGNDDDDWFFKKTNNYCVQVQVEMRVDAAASTSSAVQMPVAGGGKKHMKTKRRKLIKLNNKLNNNFKKSRLRKQRGGTNWVIQSMALEHERREQARKAFKMAIFIAIDGTRDYKRDESKKPDDCICNPDAYIDQQYAIDCARTKGAEELADFKLRQRTGLFKSL